jgi:DNA-binding CsgD family transcriptional regulator/PAS domain-containing protein
MKDIRVFHFWQCSAHTMENSWRKAYTALTFGVPSAVFVKRAKENPTLGLARLKGVVAGQGGLPIKSADEVIGGSACRAYRTVPTRRKPVLRPASTALSTSSSNGGNDACRALQRTRVVTRRSARDALERTLHCLADGVALVRADGTVVFANDSFHAIACRDDGIGLKKGAVAFADVAARKKFNGAIGAALRSPAGRADRAPTTDFIVARAAGAPPYLTSVRTLPGQRGRPHQRRAVAMVFVRDPAVRGSVDASALRDLFGLTDAEAALALALQTGVTPTAYARARRLSLNTVYTHLRRLREKTGSSRLHELIAKFDALRFPARLD